MDDLCGLIWCAIARLFRSRMALQAEILLRHQLNVLGRGSPKRVALGGPSPHWRSDDDGGNNQRKVDQSGSHPNGRRNRADVTRAWRGQAEMRWVNPFAPFNQGTSALHSGLIDPQQKWPVTRYRGSATAPAFAARLPEASREPPHLPKFNFQAM